jgi:hypothetical protein
MKTKLLMVFFCTIIHFLLYIFRAICIYSTKTTIMNQNENSNLNEDVLQHSSGVRNQLSNEFICLCSSGQTKQTTTDANGAISENDRQWLANNGGALPIWEVPAQDKAIVGTGTGAAAHIAGDTHKIGTKPLDNRPPGSFNYNSGTRAGNDNEDVLHHSSGVRNQPGGSTQGGIGPYQRTPANYAGGPGPHANSTITLYAQK